MKKYVEYSLIFAISSVEEFLKSQFKASSNKCKKYFDKSFLNRSMPARAVLKLPIDFVNEGEINPNYAGPLIEMVYEDQTFLVMNKPANLFVHPLCYDEQNNSLSFLRQTKFSHLNVNYPAYDRGLLYRLDFETSGVLVFVKNDFDYRILRDQFQKVAKKKIYRCWVEGHCQLSGSFSHYFNSSGPNGERVVVSDQPISETHGVLSIKSMRYDPALSATLLEIELSTGLRHQIRAQLAFLGYPIRGDFFYQGKPAKRLYLHAQEYQLEYLQKSYSFQVDPLNFDGL